MACSSSPPIGAAGTPTRPSSFSRKLSTSPSNSRVAVRSERSMSFKLVEYAARVGADSRLNAKLCEMIYEIEGGERQLGFQNYDELETYVNEIGKALP